MSSAKAREPGSPALRLALHGLLFLLACRQVPDGEPLLLEEAFEEACDGLPCGWSQVLGDPGGAQWITTVHPGEHGLSLASGVTARRAYDFEPRTVQVSSGALQAVISGRCEAGGALDIEVLVRDERGGADAYGGRVAAPDVWGIPVSLSLTSDFALVDGGTAIGTASPDLAVTSILLRSSGSGVCEIDHLRVDGFNRATRAPPSSCDAD